MTVSHLPTRLSFDIAGTDPFDEGLDRHIWSLSDQSLQWNGEIAKKRREQPTEVHRLMKELIETQKEVDEQEAEEYAAIVADVEELPPDCACFALFRCVRAYVGSSVRPNLPEHRGYN